MDITFEAPGPGPWQQDSAHIPQGFSPLVAEIYPPRAAEGFMETFARWGSLLDTLAWGVSNGYPYHQPVPFDLPGPDGPMAPEAIGAEIERRAAVAAGAFENKIWREVLHRWDTHLKPAAIARHRKLTEMNLRELDDAALADHLDACITHLSDMAYQHHRFNCSAIVPIADFALQVGAWIGEPPTTMYGVFDGHSPSSGIICPEIEPAIGALRLDADAIALLRSGDEAADVLAKLRASVPAVNAYCRAVGFRVIDGFGVTYPTVLECPQIILGRLSAGLEVDTAVPARRADELAANLRLRVPVEHLEAFDDLLTEARFAYRLRDERGIYSDVSAFGILRWALLEVARRQHEGGRIEHPDHIFEMVSSELHELLGGSGPSAAELAERATHRQALINHGAPRHLGSPPPGPPPLDQLPPSLARLMGAIGFGIEGILGELDAPEGDAGSVIGIPGNMGVYEGTVHLVHTMDDLLAMQDGSVLVAATTGEAFNSMIHLVGAIVTDHGSFASHAAIVARECGFPAVVGCIDATTRLHQGQRVRVDGGSGEVLVLT